MLFPPTPINRDFDQPMRGCYDLLLGLCYFSGLYSLDVSLWGALLPCPLPPAQGNV